jgi:glutamate--cysteine ligase
MPPLINSEEEISIAVYGSSNLGIFKKIYRNGLSHRYGRMMQAISGLHFNYSLPNSFWESPLFEAARNDEKQVRSSIYFNMMRNIYRFNWLILYLFGASPIVTRNFLTKDSQSFKQLDSQTFYLPDATSLRMSEYGYSNLSRNTLRVSINSIDEYVSDLKRARNTFEPKFSKFKLGNKFSRQQISQNILQIDDEFYAIARAKSKLEDMRNTSLKLKNCGVDFIELRSLDLDPFSRIGISEEAAMITELLLILCLINQSDLLSDSDFDEIDHNNSLVAKQGRMANLYLKKNGEKILLKDWAKQILESLLPISEMLDSSDSKYSNSLDKISEMIDDPGQTISGRIMDQILTNNLSFHQFGEDIGNENKSHYLNLNKKYNESWKQFEDETIRSFEMQDYLEEEKHKSFEAYLDDFLG